jgi:hypothetical protein
MLPGLSTYLLDQLSRQSIGLAWPVHPSIVLSPYVTKEYWHLQPNFKDGSAGAHLPKLDSIRSHAAR